MGCPPRQRSPHLNKIGNDCVADHFIHGMIHRLNKKDRTPLMENLPLVESSDYRQILAEGVARDLSRVNPDSATAWIPKITDEEARARAYQGVGPAIPACCPLGSAAA